MARVSSLRSSVAVKYHATTLTGVRLQLVRIAVRPGDARSIKGMPTAHASWQHDMTRPPIDEEKNAWPWFGSCGCPVCR